MRTKRPTAIFVAALMLVISAVAFAAIPDTEVRSFGPAGDGPERVSPHAAGVAVAPDGHVYVADAADGRIERFDKHGTPDGGWEAPGAVAVAVDRDGRVLVGDQDGVTAYSADGAVLQKFEAMGPVGGVAAADAGTVLATDRAAGTVVVFGADGKRTASFGSLGDPAGVAMGPDRAVYVADAATERVHRFGTTETSWPAANPHGLAVDADGQVYVAQGTAHVIGVYTAGGKRAGQVGPGDPRMNVPRGVAFDCRGSVYVVDNSNPRVHVFATPDAELPPCPPPPPPPEPTPEPKIEVAAVVEEEAPVIGKTTRATVLGGAVYAGKGIRKRRIQGRRILPIGETIDTSEGAVKLEFETTGSEDRGKFGRYMDGEFSDGEFTVHQASSDSLVELQLEDTGVGSADAGKAAASATKKKRLWVRARGRFRTVGRHGAATVRGTRWLTEERSAGTYFRVTEGTLAVRESASGKTVILNAGESFLARPQCVSRRRFWIKLRIPVGTTVTAVSVRLRGKKMPVRLGDRVRARIDLRGIPKGRVSVRISVRTATGQMLTGTRTYMTCGPQLPRPKRPPEL